MSGMAAQDSPLFARVERDVPKIARRMLDRFVEEIPLYGMLPREQLEGEIAQITQGALRLFFQSLRSTEPLVDDELIEIRSSAARRAEERVPLDAVLAAYHVGGRIGWEALVEGAHDDEREVLIHAAGRVLEFVHQVTGAVASAYLEERQSIYGEERDALRAVAPACSATPPCTSCTSDPSKGVRRRRFRRRGPFLLRFANVLTKMSLRRSGQLAS